MKSGPKVNGPHVFFLGKKRKKIFSLSWRGPDGRVKGGVVQLKRSRTGDKQGRPTKTQTTGHDTDEHDIAYLYLVLLAMLGNNNNNNNSTELKGMKNKLKKKKKPPIKDRCPSEWATLTQIPIHLR